MKPVLVLALGSGLAGDDDVGAHVLAAIATDAAVADVADLVHGGTDLFRLAPRIAGYQRLVVVDAALGSGTAQVALRPHPPTAPGDRRTHAHDLDPVAALELLRRHDPAVRAVECWWLLLEVPVITLHSRLSPAARSLIDEAAARLRALILQPPCTGFPPLR